MNIANPMFVWETMLYFETGNNLRVPTFLQIKFLLSALATCMDNSSNDA